MAQTAPPQPADAVRMEIDVPAVQDEKESSEEASLLASQPAAVALMDISAQAEEGQRQISRLRQLSPSCIRH